MSNFLETQTCLIPPVSAQLLLHRHRALFREIGIIKVTFELSSPSSARGITHNDIQCSPDHIYDSIFDTAVHQQRKTQPKRITPPPSFFFSQFKHNPFSSVNHLSLYCKCNCSDLKERGGERERERVKIIFWAISLAPLRDRDWQLFQMTDRCPLKCRWSSFCSDCWNAYLELLS